MVLTEDELRNKYVGKRLKLIRDMLGLSQEDMADKMMMSFTSYNQMEGGKRTMPQDRVRELLMIFPDLKNSQIIGEIFMARRMMHEFPWVTTKILIQQDFFKETMKKLQQNSRLGEDEAGCGENED